MSITNKVLENLPQVRPKTVSNVQVQQVQEYLCHMLTIGENKNTTIKLTKLDLLISASYTFAKYPNNHIKSVVNGFNLLRI